LTSVSIGTGVTSIGQQAFGSCIGLTSVTFNGAIPTIGTNNFTVSGDTAYYLVDATNSINTNEPSVLSKLTMFTNTVAVLTTPTTTYISQNFYLTEEFDVSANGVTAAVFDAEDTTDVSGNYPNKAEIRVEKSVVQNMFQYWTDAIDMSNAVVSDIFYRVSYTDSAVPLSPDFVVGAIMTASDPNMNPDSNLTNYLPQDYLRYLAKKLFNTTRGVDLFANETEVLQSVNTRCRVGLNQILLTYLDASANGIIRDEDDFIILDPYDPVEVAGSQKVTGNPSKKIMKQILQNDPARFVDISSNYAVAGETYWYKMPIEVGDNLYFPVTIKAPTDQQKLTQPDSTTLIEDRTYLIRCVVVADGSIPDPYNVYSYSALPSLTTFYH
jgi:phospholipase/lecithinase/hemolysin